MMIARKDAVLGLLGLSALASSGCTTALKQGYYELRGAQAEMLFVNEPGRGALDRFNGFTMAPATTDLSTRLCPPAVRSAYDRFGRRLAQQLNDRVGGGEPRLSIETQVLYYQEKGLLGAGQFLTRVRMRDGGRLIVDTLVNTRTKSFRDGAADDMAEASVVELGQWIAEQRDLKLEDLE